MNKVKLRVGENELYTRLGSIPSLHIHRTAGPHNSRYIRINFLTFANNLTGQVGIKLQSYKNNKIRLIFTCKLGEKKQ